MNDLALEHLVAGLLLIARLGDVVSTYLATPRMMLELNPVARRFKWPFAWLTVLLFLVPYWSVPMGLVLLVASLLVCASNFTSVWMIRTVGETAYFESTVEAAGRARLWPALLYSFLPAVFMMLLALTIFVFYPDPNRDWGYYIALGIIAYALVLAIYRPLALIRYRRIYRTTATKATVDGHSKQGPRTRI
jgi:hypothetical protein